VLNNILDVCGNKRIMKIRDLESRMGSCTEAVLQILALGSTGVTLTHPQCPRFW